MADDRLDLDKRLLGAFAALWRASAPPTGLAVMPHLVARGSTWTPTNQEPFAELWALLDRGEENGPVGMKNYDLPGLLQLTVQVKTGRGSDQADELVRIGAACLQAMSVQGLKVYGCRKPYDLATPLPGYYGRAVDAPARYVGP